METPLPRSRVNGLGGCPVMVLVGGLGTRLRSAYADGPKVLAPISGKPFLAYLLKLLADAGLYRVDRAMVGRRKSAWFTRFLFP